MPDVAKEEKKLTAKQERFCREYIIDYNGTQAAIRAGYSKNTAQEIASENLSKPIIKAQIETLQAEIAKKLNITTEFLTNELLENHRLARKAEKINESNRSIELVAKLHGKFIEKIETTNKTFVSGLDFSKISMDDVAQLSNLLNKIPKKEPDLVKVTK